MKKAKLKRNLAIAGMILLVIAGLLIGTIRDLAGFKAEAKEIYESGQDQNGDTIESRIARIYKNGEVLKGLAGSELSSYAEDFGDDLKELKNAKTPSVQHKLLKNVYEQAESLCQRIQQGEYSSAEKDNALRAFGVIERSMERLEDFSADYNESAKAYNKKINRFPYVFLAKPILKELSLFED